jgi:hypothetical protein
MLVQALFAESAVEALDKCVLHRFGRIDPVQRDAARPSPFVERSAREIRPVVHHDQLRLAAQLDRALERSNHAQVRKRLTVRIPQAS